MQIVATHYGLKINTKVYRCGYCGNPTSVEGKELSEEVRDRVIQIIVKYGDGHTEQTHGDCCRHTEDFTVQVTKDMAMDAGDPALEGEWITW